MISIRTKQAYKDAKMNQFKDAVESRDPKVPMGQHLKKLGYDILSKGGTTHFTKGRAIISIGGMNQAMVTLVKG
jgi:hypothetical protein